MKYLEFADSTQIISANQYFIVLYFYSKFMIFIISHHKHFCGESVDVSCENIVRGMTKQHIQQFA